MADAIVVSDLWKSYRLGDTQVAALRGLSMTVAQGAFCALVGASGSGKSTLLNLLGALDRPDKGSITIGGESLARLDASGMSALRSRKIGFVFQAFHLIPVLSVLENVTLPLHLFSELSASQQTAQARAVLDQVGLNQFAASKPGRLSGGQRQRVAIARALVTKPTVVLADEPTANLDSVTAHAIIDLLEQLNRQSQVTFLISSHDDKLIGRVSRVLRIQDGVLV